VGYLRQSEAAAALPTRVGTRADLPTRVGVGGMRGQSVGYLATTLLPTMAWIATCRHHSTTLSHSLHRRLMVVRH
jgi:hypothetical protein